MTIANSYAFFGFSALSFFLASDSISSNPCCWCFDDDNKAAPSLIAPSAFSHHSMISFALSLACLNNNSPSLRLPNSTSRCPISHAFLGRFAIGAISSAASTDCNESALISSTSPARESERSISSSASSSSRIPQSGSL